MGRNPDWAEEGWGYDIVSTKLSADPEGNSEPEWPFHDVPNWSQRVRFG